MKHAVITPAPFAPHRPARAGHARRVLGWLAKLAFGLAVFVGTCAGWLLVQYERERHSPLPNGPIAGEACALWFVGSSSMHKWMTLRHDMLPWQTHNRGINGVRLGYLADRFASEPGAVPPRAIVFYGGENDIAAGSDADATLARIAHMVAEKRRLYGMLPMFVVSVKPSPTRWRFRPQQARLNRSLAMLARRSRDIHFVDIVPLMLVNGRPGPFYQADGIHLTHAGYRRWGGAVRHAVEATLPPDLVRSCMNRRRAG